VRQEIAVAQTDLIRYRLESTPAILDEEVGFALKRCDVMRRDGVFDKINGPWMPL
jgi:hypothetical protein